MEWTNNGDQYFTTVKRAWGILLAAMLVFAANGRGVFIKSRGAFSVISLAALIESVHDKISVWTAVFISTSLTILGFYLLEKQNCVHQSLPMAKLYPRMKDTANLEGYDSRYISPTSSQQGRAFF
jgi:hypothetical protein